MFTCVCVFLLYFYNVLIACIKQMIFVFAASSGIIIIIYFKLELERLIKLKRKQNF